MSTSEPICSVLISSCDKYEDLWFPFFELFSIYWKDCPYPVFLNTEKKTFSHPKVSVKSLCVEGNKTLAWGGRLIDVLMRIDSEYVFFTLDDLFFNQLVNQKKIEECIEYMQSNKNVGAFQFLSPASQREALQAIIAENLQMSPNIEGFYKPSEKASKCLAISSLWRRQTLIKYLRSHESAWGWEHWGSIRAKRYSEEIYYELPTEHPVNSFAFELHQGGASAVLNGKWVVSIVDELFQKNGIKVDYSRMGTTTIEEYHAQTTIGIIRKTPFLMIVKKTIGVIKSLI